MIGDEILERRSFTCPGCFNEQRYLNLVQNSPEVIIYERISGDALLDSEPKLSCPNLGPSVHRSAARAAERRENRMAPVQSTT